MSKKEYSIGWAVGLVWLLLGLAIMYAISLFMEAPTSLAFLIACWLAAWPLLVGALAGWRRGEAGFGAGVGAFIPLYLVMSVVWWWLLPGLFSLTLCAKALLGGLALSAVAGGLGAGFKQARRQLAASGGGME